MSGATPIRLPLSQRQVEALAKWLEHLQDRRLPFPSADGVAALREVAEKLGTLREQR